MPWQLPWGVVPLFSVLFCNQLYGLQVSIISFTRRPAPAVCKILCSNVVGLSRNLSDLTVASSQFDILLCSETFVSNMRHVSELLVPGFGRPVVLCWDRMPRARGMAAYVRDMLPSSTYPALCFQSFSEAWYLEKALTSIS